MNWRKRILLFALFVSVCAAGTVLQTLARLDEMAVDNLRRDFRRAFADNYRYEKLVPVNKSNSPLGNFDRPIDLAEEVDRNGYVLLDSRQTNPFFAGCKGLLTGHVFFKLSEQSDEVFAAQYRHRRQFSSCKPEITHMLKTTLEPKDA